ncbi:MAG: hypothetical protein HZB91_14230 [Elusimicrobia bacterium]|nr:hypothetical protein [Elusimicrobiota bacterium]
MSDLIPNSPAPGNGILLYQTEDGRTRLEVRVQQETVWLSLNQMAELFQRDKSVISRHISNVFDEGELRREATVAKSATVQTEGGEQAAQKAELEFEKFHRAQLAEPSQVEKDFDAVVKPFIRKTCGERGRLGAKAGSAWRRSRR